MGKFTLSWPLGFVALQIHHFDVHGHVFPVPDEGLLILDASCPVAGSDTKHGLLTASQTCPDGFCE